MENKFKVGDKVKLNGNKKEFEYGRAGVSYEEIGEIREIRDKEMFITFPSFGNNWHGKIDEVVPAEFIKKDLQDGDIITLRNGDRLIFTNNDFLDMSDKHDNYLSDIYDLNDDLTYNDDDKDSDIVKVERPTGYSTVFERVEEVKEMTIAEISKALGYEVKIVKEEN